MVHHLKKTTFGNLPLGYIRRGNEVLVDEKAAAFVKDYFNELVASRGETLGQVFARVKRRHDIPIARSFSSRGARNKFYIGIIETKGEVYTHAYPRLIEPELFYVVQEKFKPQEKAASQTYLFTKLVKCGAPGCQNFLVREIQKGITYYRCHSTKHSSNTISENMLTEQFQDAAQILTTAKIFMPHFQELVTIREYIYQVCIKAHEWMKYPNIEYVRSLIELIFVEISMLNKRCTFTFQEPFFSLAQGHFEPKISFSFETIKDIVHKFDDIVVEGQNPREAILILCKVARSPEELASRISMDQNELRSLLIQLQLERKIEDDGLGKYKTL